MRGLTDWQSCRRSFRRNGHFENLLAMGSLEDVAESENMAQEEIVRREPKGWRYSPYTLTNYGAAGMREYFELPKKSTREHSVVGSST